MSISARLNNFAFDNEEYIIDRCAEVFFTNNDRFVLNCMTCYEMFQDYELFKQHVAEEHSETNGFILNEETTADSLEEYDNEKETDSDHFHEKHAEEADVNDVKLKEKTAKDEGSINNCKEDIKQEFWTIIPSNNGQCFIATEEINSQDDEFNEDGIIQILKAELDDLIVEEDELCEQEVDKEFEEDNGNSNDLIKPSNDGTKKLSRRTSIRPYGKGRVRPNNSNSERKHVCPICSFAFTDKSNLNSHIRRHGNERNHACQNCPKRFFSRTELETHKRWHTGERPYICSSCGKGCLTAGDLTVHERRHTNDRRYKCDYCEKSFFNNKHLKDHIVSHTQERNFECDICHSRFLRRKSLVSHIKIHENKREYVCNICGNAYNQKPALSIHIKSKHGVYLHKKDDKLEESV